ncbi:hypothetical protein JCM10207_002454 [Rhodosporidiobolus poonsookiae]
MSPPSSVASEDSHSAQSNAEPPPKLADRFKNLGRIPEPTPEPPSPPQREQEQEKESPPKHRRRATGVRNCEHCRHRKAKCDRVQPCSNCALRGLECVYEDGGLGPVGLSPLEKNQGDIARLRREVTRLVRRLELSPHELNRLAQLAARLVDHERDRDHKASLPRRGNKRGHSATSESEEDDEELIPPPKATRLTESPPRNPRLCGERGSWSLDRKASVHHSPFPSVMLPPSGSLRLIRPGVPLPHYSPPDHAFAHPADPPPFARLAALPPFADEQPFSPTWPSANSSWWAAPSHRLPPDTHRFASPGSIVERSGLPRPVSRDASSTTALTASASPHFSRPSPAGPSPRPLPPLQIPPTPQRLLSAHPSTGAGPPSHLRSGPPSAHPLIRPSYLYTPVSASTSPSTALPLPSRPSPPKGLVYRLPAPLPSPAAGPRTTVTSLALDALSNAAIAAGGRGPESPTMAAAASALLSVARAGSAETRAKPSGVVLPPLASMLGLGERSGSDGTEKKKPLPSLASEIRRWERDDEPMRV